MSLIYDKAIKRRLAMNTEMFWNRVKACIKERGLTQKEFAKSCRFTYGTFRNWISNNVSIPLLYASTISKCLGVSLDYLINGKEKDNILKTNKEMLLLLKDIHEQLCVRKT